VLRHRYCCRVRRTMRTRVLGNRLSVHALSLVVLVGPLLWALVVPGVANGIAIFLFRQSIADIPGDLVDAARLVGASWLAVLFQIFLPLSKPVMIGASLLLFLFQWEAFLWPLIAVRSEDHKVVQVAMSDFQLQYQTLWNELFAASTVAAVIPLLLLLPLQRYYVQSVVGTGLK
jgi:ABC-type glycerol-3-phosphate transport system permease component